MLIAALLVVMKQQKSAKFPSTDEWKSEMWYIQTRKYYLAIKINEVLVHATS